MLDMMDAFADAWEPLLAQWDREEFEVLQPRVPDPSVPVLIICGALGATSGKLQQKLQGIHVQCHDNHVHVSALSRNQNGWTKLTLLLGHADLEGIKLGILNI